MTVDACERERSSGRKDPEGHAVGMAIRLSELPGVDARHPVAGGLEKGGHVLQGLARRLVGGGQHNQHLALGQGVGDLLPLCFISQHTPWHGRHVVELHVNDAAVVK